MAIKTIKDFIRLPVLTDQIRRRAHKPPEKGQKAAGLLVLYPL
jgi:hypothetical protein